MKVVVGHDYSDKVRVLGVVADSTDDVEWINAWLAELNPIQCRVPYRFIVTQCHNDTGKPDNLSTMLYYTQSPTRSPWDAYVGDKPRATQPDTDSAASHGWGEWNRDNGNPTNP